MTGDSRIDDNNSLWLSSPPAHGVLTLGPNIRSLIVCQGCRHGCKDCVAQNTWKPGPLAITDPSSPWPKEVGVSELALWVIGQGNGLTISGGEPLDQPSAIAQLCEEVRRVDLATHDERTIDILMFTGYRRENLSSEQLEAALLVDWLVDGLFETDNLLSEEERATTCFPRGSRNQVVHCHTWGCCQFVELNDRGCWRLNRTQIKVVSCFQFSQSNVFGQILQL